MSQNYHTPIEFWLELRISELSDWLMVAEEIREEQHGH